MQYDPKRKRDVFAQVQKEDTNEKKGKNYTNLASVFSNKNIKMHLMNPKPDNKDSVPQMSLYYYTRHPQELTKLPSITKVRKGSTDDIPEDKQQPLALTQVVSPKDKHDSSKAEENEKDKIFKELPQVIKTNINFQSPINKVKFELIQSLNALTTNTNTEGNYFPSLERIGKVLDLLEKIGEEKTIFEEFMEQILIELRRAIYFNAGEFYHIFNCSEQLRQGN